MDRQNIRFFANLCKGHFEKRGADWALFLLIIFTAVASFGLGRLSTADAAITAFVTPNTTSQGASVGVVEATSSMNGGTVVASKTGSAYHLPWCPGAARIAHQNLVTFESEEDARAAGYSPAKNCKGLIGE